MAEQKLSEVVLTWTPMPDRGLLHLAFTRDGESLCSVYYSQKMFLALMQVAATAGLFKVE